MTRTDVAPAPDPKATTLVAGAQVLTMDRERQIIDDGAVAFTAGVIDAVGRTDELRARYPAAVVHDAGGCVVTPGFVNTHQHVTGDPLAKSCVPDDLAPGESIFSWAVPLNAAHDADDDHVAATLTFVDSLLNGVTTVVEAGTIAHLPAVAGAAGITGIRAGLGVWGWDIEQGPFAAPAQETLERQEATLEALPPGGRVTGWVCLVGHDLASDHLLRGAADLARSRRVRMTMHISPTSSDPVRYLQRTGVRPLVHLARLGVLGEHLLLAHAVWVDEEEARLLAETSTSVACCPWAYLRHGQGMAAMGRHLALHRGGVAVGLGCDAPNANDGTDIVDAARLAVGITKDAAIDPTVCSAYDGLEMATLGGAACAGLGGRVGALVPGMAADLVVHDGRAKEWRPRGNPVQQLVWCAQGRTVRDVFVDGRLVVRDGRCTTVDESALADEAARRQRALLDRCGLGVPQRWPTVAGHTIGERR